MKQGILPEFPYGAVYFRKTNPPQADWEKDYVTAREDGMNIFRHWFLWAAIERAPGKFQWDEYDRQMDLAAKNGMKTIIAEMTTIGPEWLLRYHDHARLVHSNGTRDSRQMHVSCAASGVNMCWDNDDYRARAENWITELAAHYKGHPGLGGYDIWNECNYNDKSCYCEASKAKFRKWLENKYHSLEGLSEAWHCYGIAEWEDVTPPLGPAPYQDFFDWEEFRIETAYGYMRRRAEIIRAVDPDCAIVAHGIAGSLNGMALRGADDWRAANEVEIYGMTWGSSRHGDESWKQFHAADLVRAAGRGKPWWHAESYAGPLWLQPNVLNKPRNEGRIASPEDARYWNFVSLMTGARGILYLRWRPLLEGDLFGAFGPYGMDGSRTDRSEAVSASCKWITAAAQKRLMASKPVKGQIGIVYVPESQVHTCSLRRTTDAYAKSTQGVYQGFFDRNIQADWVHIDDIKEWDCLYLPYPVMLSSKTIAALKEWVHAGGTLISEGCPAYFSDGVRAGTVQPGFGMDELFGVKESYVEFTPDLLGDLTLTVAGDRIWGGEYLQSYTPTTGEAVGWYDDSRVAAVDNCYGRGKTRLIGTMPGYGYSTHGGDEGSYRPPKKAETSFFEGVLKFAGTHPRLQVSDPRLTARLHEGPGGTYLWIANPRPQAIPVRIQITSGEYQGLSPILGPTATLKHGCLSVIAPARYVSIYELK